ncbi:HTH domain-containing protein [Gaoshiqia sediminis]|uniref:HTH domain-containing protein n=1 Tax=Gaoshiqia sediminis TaxID=2986998 RepID=A0AA41Y7I2_9BACT|nr:HTH domain-containing protein [Gaoshiqia sediminis]MCW0484866.1 HTH domain-containing protein [Gaoshiqia sediminis]
MKKDLTWKQAILKVLKDADEPLHYTKISELIVENEYRSSVGATPAMTVNRDLNSLASDSSSNVIKVSDGVFTLKDSIEEKATIDKKVSQKVKQEPETIINSFGIFWERDKVLWRNNPDLFGIQQRGATPVNFKEQIGIYLLYDNREVIYVGQAIKQTLGKRLYDHTQDRLSGRWNRFSWFGILSIREEGSLQKPSNENLNIDFNVFADTLESILIESIEPRQNRKQGNLFSGIDYIQEEDIELKKKRYKELGDELMR